MSKLKVLVTVRESEQEMELSGIPCTQMSRIFELTKAFAYQHGITLADADFEDDTKINAMSGDWVCKGVTIEILTTES